MERRKLGDRPAVDKLEDADALLVVQAGGGVARLTKEKLAQGITDAVSEEDYIRATEMNANGELVLTVL